MSGVFRSVNSQMMNDLLQSGESDKTTTNIEEDCLMKNNDNNEEEKMSE